ncbi:hypothetical protein [Pseudoalteromonas porphyrae]|uniref:Uncharacterized protein n=1 Tax=Pseudoalteromonas porphyrae TaxID=187330 RepID=A0A0N0M0R6_9GAMM|nr:hypothetical protein [Pseudoalteromonas porphyrae]KPH63769.1 hypothetical protein ADS77_07560 [Pseudoalteromonas porphyrae]
MGYGLDIHYILGGFIWDCASRMVSGDNWLVDANSMSEKYNAANWINNPDFIYINEVRFNLRNFHPRIEQNTHHLA